MARLKQLVKNRGVHNAIFILTLSVLAGVTKGFCGKSISKYTSEFKSAAFSNLIRMLFCIAIGFIFVLFFVYVFSKKTEQSTLNVTQIKKKGMPYIALMSVCLFLNSFFKTIASRELDMTVIAPLSQGAALVLVAIMSAVFFGEKIKTRCVIGIILAITGLLIMNFVVI